MSIDWEERGAVGLATINRPERRNALDAEHCDALRERLESQAGLRALVITGAGSAFCAGADLGTRFEDGHQPSEPADPFHDVLQRLLDAVAEHPLPVIAAVNGAALGAGTQLAVACDLRVSSPEAVFGIPAARLGIMISAASTERIVRVVGHAHAAEMLITGRRYAAEDAHRVGLAHRVAQHALADALSWAEEIAELAPLSVQGHKRSLNLVAAASALGDAGRAEIAGLIAETVASDDLREGVAAFNEKRPPSFTGR
ncbi:MAG: enoyl-CoA hydratase/isomerase family protein [Actinobacteria bacterium]|nr:enoyl-CoA hydratase/isomerase family protein [Actinomycetota bacterium]